MLYWLSKYGFEAARVDHTGIDLIARNRKTHEIMGVSVKSRSRNTGKEGQYVSIPNENFEKAKAACHAFGCTPYFAVVVDEADVIWLFITSMRHLLELFPKGKRVSGWKMTDKHITQYLADPQIKCAQLCCRTRKWW